ncbi:MAG: NAD(P)/FAD-dependent oxidoreductase [Lachnospiraceae bacterium]|nr:NAD(P)/FAD-dependent oxidoreductase [Lachnospiraceae bacterium]
MRTIVIIGAGPAGLTAAYELLHSEKKDDFNVVILEESGVIGGISRTVRVAGMNGREGRGNRMDIGGHRFFSKDQEVMDWWARMMPLQGAAAFDDKILGREKKLSAGGPDPEKENRVMLLRQRVSRIYYKHKFFDYPISLKWQTIYNMGFLTTVRAGFSYLASCLHKLEETSLENFYRNRFGKVLYSMFFEGYTEKLWGRHPGEISADWGAQRVKGLSVMAIVKDVFGRIFGGKNRKVETSLIEEFWYPKFGPGQLWETVAKEVQKDGGQILFHSAVTGFEKREDGSVAAVLYETGDGQKRMEADIVLSSMPIKDLVAGMPDAPCEVRRIADGLPYRDFVTVGLLVPSLHLVNETKIKTLNNLVPDCWIYVQDTGVKLGRIQIFNNWSPYMVEDPEHTVFIGLEYFCQEGDDFWNMSAKDCADFAVDELVSMGVLASAKDVIGFHRERVKKAYPAYFDTYDEIGTVQEWLDGMGNLYCIGRNGQHRYNNMDHSMATAFEAVKNILSGRKDKQNVWNVNTEQEYHEEKK